MKFRFKLQGLLKMLEQKRDEAVVRLQQKEEHQQRLEAEIVLLWEEMERAKQHFQQTVVGGACAQNLTWTLEHLENRRRILLRMLTYRQEILDDLKILEDELLDARREVRRVELYRERQEERVRLRTQAQVQAALDEFATLQHSRRSS